MKKLMVSIVLIGSLLRSYADEGMWLPLLLGQQVYNDMVKRGLKLSKEQLYSMNKASIKDAIIIFGGFCTGEIVSGEGLIFTNHHCGYDVLASSSSVEKNYLKDGFWAKSKQEEIPAKGLYAEFLLKIEDVTKKIEDSIAGLSGQERAARLSVVLASLNAEYSDPEKGISARISPLFKGNQFLAFVYQRYNDIRLAGAPAESIGKYGGDTDNWEWPRHTGDFSVFRAYMSKGGGPSDYSVENIPLKPKYFLPVSIKGIKDGDYAMIYGYPGGTNRYETSYGVKQKIDISNPSLVGLRDMRLKFMFEEMKKDPGVKLKLASNYANIANYWKFFDGETKQLIKYHEYEQKLAQEEKFKIWA
ncbi:MAG: S46 family peptidase, partial [Flavitalea sp.]